MIPEKMFQQILSLGEAWRVTRMDYQEKEQRVLIWVDVTNFFAIVKTAELAS